MSALLNSDALTTLGMARAYVLRDETRGDQDVLLAKLINSASKTIRRILNRQMFTESATTHSFEYEGNGFLSIAPFELRAVTSLVVTPAGATGITLDPTVPEYTLQPFEKTDEGTYLWLRLLEFDQPRTFPRWFGGGLRSQVTITGDWGMEIGVPDDVEEACLITVREAYKNPDGGQSERIGDLSIVGFPRPSVGEIPPLPPKALSKIEYLRRNEIGV